MEYLATLILQILILQQAPKIITTENLADLYSNEFKSNVKILYANWDPGGPIELGDYGILNGNIFIPVRKLRNDFPEFNAAEAQLPESPTKLKLVKFLNSF